MKVIFYLNSPTYYCWLQYVLVLQLLLQRSTHVFLCTLLPTTAGYNMSLCSNYCYTDQHMCSSPPSYLLLLATICPCAPITATKINTCVLLSCHANYCYKDQHICSSAPSYLLLLQWYTHVFFRPVIPITATKINTYVPL